MANLSRPDGVLRELALFAGAGGGITADALGFSLDEIASQNITKLRKRYPQGFDHAASIERED